MQAHVAVGPLSTRVCCGAGGCSRALPFTRGRWRPRGGVRAPPLVIVASSRHSQNHYAVLGVPRSATPTDIKAAYRLLALKWHPDVNKDSRADEVFKSIRLAYDVLSNEATRLQYDRSLTVRKDDFGSNRKSTYAYYDNHDRINVAEFLRIVYGRNPAKKGRQRKRNWKHYKYASINSSNPFFREEAGYDFKDVGDKDGSFSKIMGFSVMFLLLVKSVGCSLSLTLSSLMALFDQDLDGGYKVGYLMAWFMGGMGGVLLTLFLYFASWAVGKASSGMAVAVVVAMWIGSTLASYCPIPQGALIALLYMSMKLQGNLN